MARIGGEADLEIGGVGVAYIPRILTFQTIGGVPILWQKFHAKSLDQHLERHIPQGGDEARAI